MRTAIVRYKVRPEMVDANEALIQNIFKQLDREKIAGLQYQAYKLSDGVSFVHVVSSSSDRQEDSPLPKLQAFQEFVAGLRARCEEPPLNMQAHPIGAYANLT